MKSGAFINPKMLVKETITLDLQFICDISNISCFNKRKEKPRLRNIDLFYSKIPEEIKIVGIADSSLYHQIDDKKRYKKQYLNSKIITEAPAGYKADGFILTYAFDNNTLIISNDQFKEYEFIPQDWLKKHRIGFMIISEQFYFENPIELIIEKIIGQNDLKTKLSLEEKVEVSE